MATESGWKRFWNHGTWWKALLVVVVYWGLYQLCGLASGALFGGLFDLDEPLTSPAGIFFGVALPILLGSVLLVAFAASLGWLRELFGRQPVGGRAWMWLAVVLVLVPIVIRLVAVNWSAWGAASVLALLFVGLCVGFAEELLTRGLVVNILRKGGHGERFVFVLSSLYFALLHSGNVITGQSPVAVAITVVYTFGFGAMMYLSLRVTGRLVWAILLHAATDPTTILATGGIDAHGASTAGDAGLIAIAGIFNYVYVLFALVAIFLVKNRERAQSPEPVA
jgi:membrane protease YdiL (CAAX protease family)